MANEVFSTQLRLSSVENNTQNCRASAVRLQVVRSIAVLTDPLFATQLRLSTAESLKGPAMVTSVRLQSVEALKEAWRLTHTRLSIVHSIIPRPPYTMTNTTQCAVREE